MERSVQPATPAAKVVVVDDSPILLEATSSELEAAGWRVYAVGPVTRSVR